MRESRSYGSVRGARGETRVPTATVFLYSTFETPRMSDWERDRACFGTAKASRCFVREQLGQRADDAVGPDRGARRQAVAVHVDPDRVDAEPLRCHDFPFQIVADHPGVARGDAERLHGVQIGALLRLAKTVLAF